MIRLYRVSEEPGIERFEPRQSPQRYSSVRGDVVFAISEEMLHLYLTPRDCPRVCYMAGPGTSERDRMDFLGQSPIVMAVKAVWRPALRETVLYCYELPSEGFELLDTNAGYYTSYQVVQPLSVTAISQPLGALAARGVQVEFVADLWSVAEEVSRSSLRFSCIRMRNTGG